MRSLVCINRADVYSNYLNDNEAVHESVRRKCIDTGGTYSLVCINRAKEWTCVLWYYKGAIRQMYLNGVTAPFGCTSGWAAPGGLEYLTVWLQDTIAIMSLWLCRIIERHIRRNVSSRSPKATTTAMQHQLLVQILAALNGDQNATIIMSCSYTMCTLFYVNSM